VKAAVDAGAKLVRPVEDKFYRAQLSLAKEFDMLVQVHTPHRDKKSGTTRSMDVAIEMGIDPERLVIDHNNEETVEEVLDRGFWAAFTIYPHTKMDEVRMTALVKKFGPERIIINSAADWGVMIYENRLALLVQPWAMLAPVIIIGVFTIGTNLMADGIARLMQEERVLAYEFEGRRYDCGSKLGYLEATVDYGLQHQEVGAAFGRFLAGRR